MRNNIRLQIEMIDNKIERLKVQKDFYERILNNEDNNNNRDHSPDNRKDY